MSTMSASDGFTWAAKDLGNGGVSYEVNFQANNIYSAGFYSPTASLAGSVGSAQVTVASANVEGDASISWTPNDTNYSSQWSLSNIGVPTAWDYQRGGRSDVKIAVIDTGLTVTGDLTSTRFDTANQWDFVNNDNTVTDGHGHGTFCISEIAAGTNNSTGIAGIAYNTTILALKALSDSGSGTYTGIANAINQAVTAGADIISMSLGGSSSSTELQTAITNAYNHGVLVVAAAGNDGSSTISYPGACDHTLAVGSTTSSNTLSSFSNHSTNMVVAPGSSILGMTNTGSYEYWSGTSMATPEVAAVAALVLSEAQDNNLSSLPGENSSRADWLRSIITSTVTDLGTSGQDSTYGYGKVNAASALAAVQSGGGGTPTDDYAGDTTTSGSVSVGSSVTGTIGSSGDRDWFAVTLTSGRNYQFNLEGSPTSQGTLSDPYLYFYNSSGTLITSANDGGSGANSRLTYSATSSGTYYLGAAANGTGTGTYKLSANQSDDFAGDTSTTGTVTVGGSNSGDLETTGDRDWFKITLTAGSSYYFDLKGSSSSSGTLIDPYLFLYNSSGSQLSYDDDSGNGYDSRVTYSATQTGTYYLGASAYNDNYTGTYAISAGTYTDDYTSGTDTGGSLSVGGSNTGTINWSGDSDWFRMSLTSGTEYYLTVKGSSSSSGTLANPYLTLYNSSGGTVTSIDNGGTGNDSLLTYTSTSTGTFFLGATSSGNSGTGTYTVTLEQDDYAGSTSTTGTVAIGGSTTGSVQKRGDSDWFAVTLEAGWGYQFDLEGSSTSKGTLVNPFLGLANSSGTLLATANDGGTGLNSRLTYSPATGGTYYLIEWTADGGTGTYTVSASKITDDYTATTGTTGTVAVGGSTSGTVDYAGDNDWFAVSLTSGTEYFLGVKGASSSSGTLVNPYLKLYDSTGTLVISRDDGGTGYDASQTYTAGSTGTYYLSASSASTTGLGTYSVTVEQDDYAGGIGTTGTVAIGGSTTGNVQKRGDSDWFAVTLEAGWGYQFDLEGSSTSKGTLVNPFLGLANSSGTLLTSANDGGTGLNSRLTYSPATGGTYYLIEWTADGGTGTYTVSASKITDDYTATTGTTGTVAVGGSTSGTVDYAGDNDWFAVSLTSGTEYFLGVKGASSSSGTLVNPYLNLYDSAGTLLISRDNGGTGYDASQTYTAGSTGTYYLSASSASTTGLGTYSVNVEQDDYAGGTGTTGTVAIGGSTTGNVQKRGDSDWFAVTLEAGQGYQFDLEGSSTSKGTLVNPFLGLANSSGTLLSSANDGGTGLNSRLTYSPATGGTYYLIEWTADGGTGTYTVSASTLTDDYTATTGTTGTVAVGGSTSGTVDYAGDNDWFAVDLTAGNMYYLNVKGSSSSSGTLVNPYLTVYNSSGSSVGSSDNGGTGYDSYLVYTAGSTGTYYLSASSALSSGTGTYNVSVGQDDYTADTGTSGTVAVGGSTSGSIGHSGDSDWFAMSLTSGTEYFFNVKGSSSSSGTLVNPYLKLYDGTGTLLISRDNGGTGYDASLTYTIGSTGTYYLSASSASTTGLGTYSVNVEQDDYAGGTGTTGTVAVGGSTTGNVQKRGDSDWFAVTLEAGWGYQFDLEGSSTSKGTLVNPFLGLADSSGTLLATANDGGTGLNSRITYSPATGGTYYLIEWTADGGTGTYTMSASKITDDYTATTGTTGTVAVGGSTSGTVDFAGDNDWFAVSLTSGTEYFLGVKGASSSSGTLVNPYLKLYDSSGSLLISRDNGGTGYDASQTYTAGSTGTYYLSASSASVTGLGTYSVTVEQDDYAGSTSTTGTVAIGGSTTGSVQKRGDSDWFAVTLSGGATYQFDLEGSSTSKGTLVNPFLGLANSSGTLLATANDGGTGLNSRLTYSPATGGTYYLIEWTADGGTGTYTMSATQTDDYAGNTSTTAALSIPTDSTVVYQNGTIESAGDRDWFRVDMVSGYSFHFDAEGTDTSQGTLSDTYLYLYNSSGSLLASSDGGGTGNNAHLDYDCTTSAAYYVAVGASGDTLTGTYRLSGWDPPTEQDTSGLSSSSEATLTQVSNSGGSAAVADMLAASSASTSGSGATSSGATASGAETFAAAASGDSGNSSPAPATPVTGTTSTGTTSTGTTSTGTTSTSTTSTSTTLTGAATSTGTDTTSSPSTGTGATSGGSTSTTTAAPSPSSTTTTSTTTSTTAGSTGALANATTTSTPSLTSSSNGNSASGALALTH